MKKWFLVISSVLLAVILAGGLVTLHGHGERNYQTYVQQGRYDVIDRNYRDALNYFQGAHKVDPNNLKVERDLSQVQSYVSGNHYFHRNRLAFAAKSYRRSIRLHRLAAVTRRAVKRYNLVINLRHSSARFARWYDQAIVLNHRRDFKASARRLSRIMKDPDVNQKYFKSFKVKVKKLMRADHQNDRSRQVTTDVKGTSKSFKLKSPQILKGHPNKVTITRARHEIQRAGVNVREMSNNDVINVIRQARQHHSSVGKYAKDNY